MKTENEKKIWFHENSNTLTWFLLVIRSRPYILHSDANILRSNLNKKFLFITNLLYKRLIPLWHPRYQVWKSAFCIVYDFFKPTNIVFFCKRKFYQNKVFFRKIRARSTQLESNCCWWTLPFAHFTVKVTWFYRR